jgi:hypothetical protein
MKKYLLEIGYGTHFAFEDINDAFKVFAALSRGQHVDHYYTSATGYVYYIDQPREVSIKTIETLYESKDAMMVATGQAPAVPVPTKSTVVIVEDDPVLEAINTQTTLNVTAELVHETFGRD